MHADAVIGCSAVDAGSESLLLSTAAGAVRTVPWSAVRLAGMSTALEGHFKVQGVTDRVSPYLATHDSLWLVYAAGGFAQVMLEKGSPERDAILDVFAKHLHDRWRGDELTPSELSGAMLIPPKIRIPKAVVIAMVVLAAVFFLSMAILFYSWGARPSAH